MICPVFSVPLGSAVNESQARLHLPLLSPHVDGNVGPDLSGSGKRLAQKQPYRRPGNVREPLKSLLCTLEPLCSVQLLQNYVSVLAA